MLLKKKKKQVTLAMKTRGLSGDTSLLCCPRGPVHRSQGGEVLLQPYHAYCFRPRSTSFLERALIFFHEILLRHSALVAPNESHLFNSLTFQVHDGRQPKGLTVLARPMHY